MSQQNVGETITRLSAAAIEANRCVKLNSTAQQAALAGAGEVVFGVSLNKTSAANQEMAVARTGTVKLPTSGAVAINDLVKCAANGFIVKAPPSGMYYEQIFGADANTTVTTAGTYYPVEGTTAAGSAGTGFTLTAGDGTIDPKLTLTETGLTSELFYVAASGSFQFNTGTGSGDIKIGLAKNGTLLTDTLNIFDSAAEDVLVPFSFASIVPMTTDDYLQLVVTSDTNSDIITVSEAILLVNQLRASTNIVGRALQAAASGDYIEVALMLNS